MLYLFNKEKRERVRRYKLLRAIRRERDYEVGIIQYADRPFTFRPMRIDFSNGKLKPKHITTTQFIKMNRVNI